MAVRANQITFSNFCFNFIRADGIPTQAFLAYKCCNSYSYLQSYHVVRPAGVEPAMQASDAGRPVRGRAYCVHLFPLFVHMPGPFTLYTWFLRVCHPGFEPGQPKQQFYRLP